ncbi:insulin receptor substrate 1-B-like isoform X4 [Arapaima gigas]
METPPSAPQQSQQPQQRPPDDVRRSGYLRKHKSAHRRFFVLRAASERGPARLECYESEKKFRAKAAVPKKSVNLETCFNINKRADARHRHMIVLYTRAESFAVAAESGAEQEEWYRAMLELQCRSKAPGDGSRGGDYGAPSPGPAFKEVWQVKVWPKGLGQAKNLVGIYRLCLTEKTVNFVKLNSDAAAVVLQLMNVRRCGHSDNFFFVEVGRSAVTGPGEFWMQVEDSVVAQNMHETLLEAMKALSEEFRQRSKSQSTTTAASSGGAAASNPISVPSRRLHPNPPPSQVGLPRRPRTEPPGLTGGSCDAGASPTHHRGIPRVRTASDGAGSADSGAVVEATGPPSCSGTPVLRSHSTRSTISAKTPHGLMRSLSTPVPSPGPTLSSESAGGAESISSSPSNCGSSDECGSSPVEHCLLSSDDSSNYIMMDQRGATEACGLLRRSSSRENEADRRPLSKRASLPPMTLERVAPRHRPEDDVHEDYAVMSRSASRESFTTRDKEEAEAAGGGGSGLDNGYMAMLPGVTAASPASPSPSLSVSVSDSASKTSDDYMAMTPSSSVSPPQHIQAPPTASDGYMIMSPHSSCSPIGVAWLGSDYMNMSPVGARSASSTPPPHPEPLLQQPPPKTVCSYYSLPRSYKHMPRGTFEEDGRFVVRGSAGRCSPFSSRGDIVGGAEGRESLPSPGGEAVQQRLDSGMQKQVHQKRSRPISLFVDVSKANTLPRVRETPCPPEPKSPGEYVSIEFRGGGSGDMGSLQRPASCLPSEYVNMELGASPSPSALSLTPLGFPPFPTPPSPPSATPKASTEQGVHSGEEEGPGLSPRSPEEAFADYTEMAFGQSEVGHPGSNTTPTALSPGKSDTLGTGSHLPLGLDYPLARSGGSVDQGAKVVRADPQGRRRHCSETFQAPSSAPMTPSSSSSSSSLYSEQGQAVARRFGFGGVPEGTCQGATGLNSTEQGLNYIDLDLVNREGARSTVDVPTAAQTTPPWLFSTMSTAAGGGALSLPVGGSSSPSGLNTYASIDFYRSEELRSHQGGGKGGTEC